MRVCVFVSVFLKGQLKVGAFYLFAFLLLEEEETKLNWTAALGLVQTRRQHVAHKGLGRLASRRVPLFVLFF